MIVFAALLLICLAMSTRESIAEARIWIKPGEKYALAFILIVVAIFTISFWFDPRR